MNNRQVDIKTLQLKTSANLSDAIRVIDTGQVQIALIVDAHECLIGTITDGDIRRALLRGEGLEASVEKIMFRNFRALSINATEEEALSLMRRETLHQIPVIDERGRVTRLFLLEELTRPRKLPNSVIIMAGGKGKRLGPLTQDSPKPMLRVGGKPLMEIILKQCIDAGFQHFYFSVNYLKNQIKEYFGDGTYWGVEIDYLEETQPLGTGGALSLLPREHVDPLLVLNGDVLTRVDFGRLLRFHDEQKAAATMCVREHTIQIPYGVVNMNGLDVLKLEEKPSLSRYVNAGIYILEPKLLEFVPKDQFFDMPQLLEKAIERQQRVSAFPVHEYWLDVGLPETLERAHLEWDAH
jgi:dTDP-glucose pyrophosphorylase